MQASRLARRATNGRSIEVFEPCRAPMAGIGGFQKQHALDGSGKVTW